MAPTITVVLDLLALLGKLLETRSPEDVKAHLERLRDEGVAPITVGDLDTIADDVAGR